MLAFLTHRAETWKRGCSIMWKTTLGDVAAVFQKKNQHANIHAQRLLQSRFAKFLQFECSRSEGPSPFLKGFCRKRVLGLSWSELERPSAPIFKHLQERISKQTTDSFSPPALAQCQHPPTTTHTHTHTYARLASAGVNNRPGNEPHPGHHENSAVLPEAQ